MRIHYLQHVPFEDLGMMAPVLMKGGHQLSKTQFFKSCALPSVNDFDCLIVMGGPMGVNDGLPTPGFMKKKN